MKSRAFLTGKIALRTVFHALFNGLGLVRPSSTTFSQSSPTALLRANARATPPRVGTRVGTRDKRISTTVEDTAVPVRRACSSRHSALIRGLCVLWDAREVENECDFE